MITASKPLPERIDKALNWLGTSRDNWRDKAQIAKEELKKKTLAVKRARESRDEYKELLEEKEKAYRVSQELLEQKNLEIIELQKQLEEAQNQVDELKKRQLAPVTGKPRHHTYWNSLIAVTLALMSTACLSFNGVANAMEVFCNQGKIDRAPSLETCIQWEMKLGLYKLSRPKALADDWVWLADHVVSKGIYKCLAVMGVRMSTLLERKDLTLCYEDLEPLGIVPMKVSNGTLMEAELESILEVTHGIPPLAIIKDQGSDLRSGGRAFSEAHPGVINLDDTPHRIARLYEHLLKEDEAWKKFTTTCANFKKEVQLTEYSTLAPPNQRAKARYHNIDVLVDWGKKKLLRIEELSLDERKKLKWLMEYEPELEYWSQLVDIGRAAREFVRRKGLWLDCYEEFEDRLLTMKIDTRAEEFACDVDDIIVEAGNKIPKGKRVIGSTEILESVFGKHKSIAGRGPKPMGRLILSMASRVGEEPTESIVQSAFERIKERDVDEWLSRAFGGKTHEKQDTVWMAQNFYGREMESRILVA